jgi:hypothetical protein
MPKVPIRVDPKIQMAIGEMGERVFTARTDNKGRCGVFMNISKIFAVAAVSATLLVGVGRVASASDDQVMMASRPLVGEVRTFAIPPSNADALNALRRSGWIEARGQLVPTSAFPELYKMLGRGWTGRDVPADEFALPELHDRVSRGGSNPYGVLNGSDLVSRHDVKPSSRHRTTLSYWIYVGQDASQVEAMTEARR